MNHSRKIILLSGAFLVMQSLSACDIAKMESYFAPDRRLPDGSDTTFDNRHSPLLNPGNNDNTRQIPTEEHSGSLDKNTNSAENSIPTVQGSPVVPVTTNTMPTMAANMPASTPATDPFAPPSADSNSSYPALASVPQKPDVPPKSELKSDYNLLVAQQKSSDAERKSLMNDADATVMTSPQTGQLVANPADAVPASATATQPIHAVSASEPLEFTPATPAAQPQAAQNAEKPVAANTDNDKSFGSWLGNLFSPEKKTADATTSAAADSSPVRRVPSENPSDNMGVAAANTEMPPAEAQATSNGAPMLHAPKPGRTVVVSQAQEQSQAQAQTQANQASAAPTLDSPPQALFQQAGASATASNPMPAVQTPTAAPAGTSVVSNTNMENDFPVNRQVPAEQSQLQETAKTGDNNGLGSWMREIFGSSKKTNEAKAESQPPAATASIEQTPLPAPNAIQAAAPATPMAAANTNLPPVSALQQRAPTDLAPAPAASAANAQPLPAISQLSNSQDDKPVNLVQPSEYSATYSGDGYLGDSRYADRMHSDN